MNFGGLDVWQFNNNYLRLGTNNTERFRIDSGGLVGIGTNNPDAFAAGADDLVIRTTGDTGVTIRSGSSNSGSILFASADNATSNDGVFSYLHNTKEMRFQNYGGGSEFFTFYAQSSEKLRIDASGRLLVGTTSNFDSYLNQISSSSGTLLSVRRTSSNPASIKLSSGSSGDNVGNNSQLGYLRWYGFHTSAEYEAARIAVEVDGANGASDMPGRLIFSTTIDGASTPTERLRITSAGDFGYGTDSPGCFFEISKDDSGATVQQKLLNRSTDANSSSNNFIYVNGAAAGDPFTTWTVGGVTSWSMGIDNSDSDKLVINNGSNLSSNLISIDTSGNVTLNANLDLQDSDKILLGTGDDLQIYHNGSHSFIADTSGTSNLYLNSNKVVITNAADTETLANFIENGAVEFSTTLLKNLKPLLTV